MGRRARIASLVIAALVALSSLAFAPPAHATADWPGLSWQSTQLRDHPLLATIRDARSGRPVSLEDVVARLQAAPFRLIGEVHDNPDHHRIQAWLIRAIHAHRQGAVVFEHIRTDQAATLAQFAALQPAEQTATQLFDLLVWERSGWPARALFEPLFGAVLARGLTILPGEAARDRVRSIARQGAATITAEEHARLALAQGLPDAEQSALLDELEASHCGLMPRRAFGGMALAQRYRDAHLARAMVDAAAAGPVTLVAGNGHVQAGRGVPWHLARMAPGAEVVTVAILEVSEGKTDAAAAVPRDAAAKPIADVIIFTPRVARDDPCVAMRRQFAPKPLAKP